MPCLTGNCRVVLLLCLSLSAFAPSVEAAAAPEGEDEQAVLFGELPSVFSASRH